jgi:ankyrin repeat protein
MSKDLPPHPSLEHLKKQAKALLHDFEQGDPEAAGKFRAGGLTSPQLSDAQHLIAREYGFTNWTKLKEYIESAAAETGNPVQLFHEALSVDDADALARLLDRYPQYRFKINEPVFPFDSPPILHAAGRGHRRVVDLLLREGADINARSGWWAGSFGVLDSCDPEMASFLIERGAIVDAHAAARLGMMDRLKELVSANPALVHARGGDGQTPLHFAATVEIAAYLLDQGADIDARDIDHESTAAQYMVDSRQEIVRYLISRGAKTDLLMAAAVGDVDLVRKHLNADPEAIRMAVNERYFPKRNPKSGGTIYTWALGGNRTAHQVARKFGHTEVFELLMDQSPADVKLTNAVWTGDEANARGLLAEHPNLIESLPDESRHQISDAAESNNTQAVRLMLELGWPVDGGSKETPLHWAAWHGNAEMVRMILRFHPPLERPDPEFNAKPIGWATHGSEHGWNCKTGDYAAVVEELLKAGAEPPIKAEGTEAVRDVLRRYGVTG